MEGQPGHNDSRSFQHHVQSYGSNEPSHDRRSIPRLSPDTILGRDIDIINSGRFFEVLRRVEACQNIIRSLLQADLPISPRRNIGGLPYVELAFTF